MIRAVINSNHYQLIDDTWVLPAFPYSQPFPIRDNSSELLRWRHNGVQAVWHRIHSIEMRHAQAVVIVQQDRPVLIAAFQKQLDGCFVLLRRENSFAQARYGVVDR